MGWLTGCLFEMKEQKNPKPQMEKKMETTTGFLCFGKGKMETIEGP